MENPKTASEIFNVQGIRGSYSGANPIKCKVFLVDKLFSYRYCFPIYQNQFLRLDMSGFKIIFAR